MTHSMTKATHVMMVLLSKTAILVAIAEPIIAGRITPDMLAVPCLYHLRSAHVTVRRRKSTMNGSMLFLIPRA